MRSTPLLQLPYPAPNADPFYADFERMVQAFDTLCAALVEDRNVILTGGGTLTWAIQPGGKGRLTWSDAFVVTSPATGRTETVAAGSVDIDDGTMLYVRLVRRPVSNPELALVSGQRIDLDQSPETPYVLGLRRGTSFVFRTGLTLADGSTGSFTGGGAGGGALDGDVYGVSDTNTVGRLRGAQLRSSRFGGGEADGMKLTPGDVLTVIEGADPRVVVYDGTTVYVLRTGVDDIIAYEPDAFPVVRRRASLPQTNAPYEPLYGTLALGYLWVYCLNGYLLQVDTTTLRVRQQWDTTYTDGLGLVYDGAGYLWLAREDAAEVVKFSLTSYAFGVVSLPGTPTAIAVGGDSVWIGSSDAVFRVVIATQSITTIVPSIEGTVVAMAVDAVQGKLWYTIDGADVVAEAIVLATGAVSPDNVTLAISNPGVGAVEGTRYFVTYELEDEVGITLVTDLDTTPVLAGSHALPGHGKLASIVSGASESVYVAQLADDRLYPLSGLGGDDTWLAFGGRLAYLTPDIPEPVETGTLIVNVVEIDDAASPYTPDVSTQTVAVDSTNAAVTVTLPASVAPGFTLDVKDSAGQAATNNITIEGTGGVTIDGVATFVISANYGSVTLRFLTTGKWMVM